MKEFAGKRVLMLLENCFYPGDVRVSQEAAVLLSAGYLVSVICPQKKGQPWCEIDQGVRVYRYLAPVEAGGFWGYVWEYGYSLIAMLLLSLSISIYPGFDIIHTANPPDTTVFIGMLYKLFGKKFIFDHHDLSPEMYQVRFPGGKSNHFVYQILLWLEWLSCRVADHVISTNQSYKMVEMLRDQVSEERITIVRNGPDLNHLSPVPPDIELRNRASTLIGYVGFISYQDGLDYLLRALRHLIQDLGRSDFFCVVIGKIDRSIDLDSLVKQFELENNVWLTGYIPEVDLFRYISSVDICVDPDPSNAFNDRCTMIKMMEYMAFEKPIVAFDLPEHRVTARDSALYARPNDELDFARQIAELLDDPEKRKRMGKKGRERVENALAWKYQQNYLLEAYSVMSSFGRHSSK
jgi:glycosyltransferase involved in cell wall biosynthesis